MTTSIGASYRAFEQWDIFGWGFVYAAQRISPRFASVIKVKSYGREHTRLVEDQRRLILIREQASTPERLQAAARELGLQPLQARK